MFDYNSNNPDQVIDKSKGGDKVWLEATTINILPGENLSFDLSEKDDNPLQADQDKVEMVCTVDEQGMAKAFVSSFNVDEEKEASLNLLSQGEEICEGIGDSPEIVEGWWSIDIEGEKRISRAFPGMTVYFHVKTQFIDILNLELFDHDPEEEGEDGEDDPIKLVRAESGLAFFEKEAIDNKVVFKITFGDLKNRLEKEEDNLLELFFRCYFQTG